MVPIGAVEGEIVRMARTPPSSPRRNGWTLIPPTVTLALWRLGRTWRLLVNTGLGILAAVMLVCAVPLFSQVAASAGLRSALRADPLGSSITFNVQLGTFSADQVAQVQSVVTSVVQRDMGSYVSGAPQFSIQTTAIPLVAAKTHLPTGNALGLLGEAIPDLAHHVSIISGRLPNPESTTLEIALTPQDAQALNAQVGTLLALQSTTQPFDVRVVGMVTQRDPNESFWHGQTLQPYQNGNSGIFVTGIAANDALLADATLLSATSAPSPNNPVGVAQLISVLWSYPLDLSRLSADNLGDLTQRFNSLQVEGYDGLGALDAVRGVDINSGLQSLADFQTRIIVLQVPITLLLVQVLALVLFFVSLMTDILVERQADAIAVLRSRGASRRQIFGALTTQSVGLGLIALVVGPLLAILGVRLVAQHALPAADQDALNIINGNPLAVALGIRWYILIAVLGSIAAMAIAINRAMNLDVLAFRRDAARTTRRPLWQRLNLDLVAAVIGVTGYIGYVLVEQRLAPQIRNLLSPLALIAPFFLLLAATLLFLRVFPLVLRLGSWLATRSKGAAPMLALAQMARSPRQALRMTLLLALTTAFTIFSLIFVASQTQHTLDAANYSVGADFSGHLPGGNSVPAETLTTAYRQVTGVDSATAGLQTSISGQSTAAFINVQLNAVDADTFAQTGLWTAQDSTTALNALMQQLVAGRANAVTNDAVPAIVDEAMWQSFHLSQDPHFTLAVPGYTGGAMHFVAVARVMHIPSIYDAPDFNDQGGVVADFQSYRAVYRADVGTDVGPNFIWLRTQHDAASLATVRAAINDPTSALRLEGVQDRLAIIAAAQSDPLQIDLLGILIIAAITASLLGILGVLVASWINARNRQTSFAVLRALGSDPRQIANTLLWEQGIIYGTALLLGIALGGVLASVVLPTLVFTSLISSSNAFLVNIDVPPIQTVLPLAGVGGLLGGLIILFLGALALMTRVVSQPSVSQTLRLNED
jgi:ABC-type antimicrobial peptide transport system permease subunit